MSAQAVGCWTALEGTASGGIVPHVELSLSELAQAGTGEVVERRGPSPSTEAGGRRKASDPLRQWAETVRGAVEPCLVIDSYARVIAISSSCLGMLGLSRPPLGQRITDSTIRLIDFSAEGDVLTQTEVSKIPPLLSLSSGRLARGLIRVECDEGTCTLDAVATPIGEQTNVLGSLTFFSPV